MNLLFALIVCLNFTMIFVSGVNTVSRDLLEVRFSWAASYSFGNLHQFFSKSCVDTPSCVKEFYLERRRYVIQCSEDGSKHEITFEEEGKKWCVSSTRQCYPSQMEAAKAACKQS